MQFLTLPTCKDAARWPQTTKAISGFSMCNLYSMTRAREAMLRLFRVGDNRAAAVEPTPAIFPGYVAPIVRRAEDGERELVKLNWGFVLLQNGLAPRRVTNVRDDKILTSKFWRPSFRAAPLPGAGDILL